MDPLTIAAAAGTRARLETLDLLANNIANSNTAGFKADREFYGLYLSAEAREATDEPGRPLPTDLPEIEHHWTDYSQGSLTGTGNPLDLAISGQGFFEILTAGGKRWTRNGTFRIGVTGKLETLDGDTLNVIPPPGRDFVLDSNKAFAVGSNGEITQDGQFLGTIPLSLPGKPSTQLEKVGNSYFMLDTSPPPAVATGAEIHQAFVETANTNVADSAVRLVSVMRQFEMLQKATNLGSDMNKQSIQEVGRIGS
ncbi:MAG TPA: flagellar hook-basal body complex protein [Bryobacteraceae bacterium]|jgi:flagellar basal body rod protein FlgG